MKSFLIASAFVLTFAYVIAAPQLSEIEHIRKEELALQECNVTYPVSQDQRERIGIAVIKGERIEAGDPSQWCNLYCYLQKVGFFDQDGNIQAANIYKYAISNSPELAGLGHVLAVQLYNLKRSSKAIEDKCLKAFVSYKEFVNFVMTNSMAADLNTQTNIRKLSIESIFSGNELSKDVEQKVITHLQNTEKKLIAELPK